jgi:uncharacterized membrane protein
MNYETKKKKYKKCYFMDKNIIIGLIVGLVTATSFYVWNSDNFTKIQKTFLLIFVVFAPLQWVSILIILLYNKIKRENTVEFKDEIKQKFAIENLKELNQKGILTDEEFKSKFENIKVEKERKNLKNSTEYKQLKSLYNSNILTKDEFHKKTESLKSDSIQYNYDSQKSNIENNSNLSFKKIISVIRWILGVLFILSSGLNIISSIIFLNHKEISIDIIPAIIAFIIGLFLIPTSCNFIIKRLR